MQQERPLVQDSSASRDLNTPSTASSKAPKSGAQQGAHYCRATLLTTSWPMIDKLSRNTNAKILYHAFALVPRVLCTAATLNCDNCDQRYHAQPTLENTSRETMSTIVHPGFAPLVRGRPLSERFGTSIRTVGFRVGGNCMVLHGIA